MRSWEQRESARTGKPVQQVLAELLEQSGGKWGVIGAMAGMSGQAAYRMFERNGIRKEPVWNFEFRGKTGSMAQHCKKYGLAYFCVRNYASRHGISHSEAMERYLSGQVRKYHWGVPQP